MTRDMIPLNGADPTRSKPISPLAALRPTASACSACATVRRASRRKLAPIGVSASPVAFASAVPRRDASQAP